MTTAVSRNAKDPFTATGAGERHAAQVCRELTDPGLQRTDQLVALHEQHHRQGRDERLRGLVAGVLGLDGSELLPAEARCGVRLLADVRTVAQELSLHELLEHIVAASTARAAGRFDDDIALIGVRIRPD